MIIATDNTQQVHPGRGPWWQGQNVPPGHQNQHHGPGNFWTQPVIIIQESTRTDGNHLPTPQTPITDNNNNSNDGNTNNNNNNNHQPNTTPQYHGGEGQIDIRIGAK